MAKHPHRLMLNQKKTWRCTLPGCKYFIHIGLAHILPGHQSICWGCGEEFRLDEFALMEDQPRCDMCRAQKEGMRPMAEIGEIIELKMALSKAGVKSVSELSAGQKSVLKAAGVNLNALDDQVEVIPE